MALETVDLENIIRGVVQGIEAERRASAAVDYNLHKQHHEFVAVLIREHGERAELWGDVRKHVVRWGSIGVISGAAWLAWEGFKAWFQK
jgi:hypothetical protein